MKISQMQRALAAMFGAALVALPTSGALADSTAAEIRALKAKLHQLEQRLSADEHGGRKQKGSNALVVKGGPEHELAPDRFYYKGVTIKPGGFIALESVWRDRWLGADVNTNWGAIPTQNNAASHANEFRFSARQSRVSLLAQGDVNASTHLTGYVEVDFLGAAQTANSNQSNSYTPRIRQVLTNVDWDEWGLHLTAGQQWSLATLYSQGLKWDTFLTPPVIDAAYLPGFFWARQPGVRIVKDLPYNLTAGFSVESPQTNNFAGVGGSTAPGVVVGFPGLTAGIPGVAYAPVTLVAPQGGGLFNSGVGYSLTRLPDIIGKLAWDPTLFDRHIHIEGFGILRDITDRAFWGNHSVWAGGAGGGAVIPLWPKLLDFQVSGVVGKGIGRYGASGLPDAALSVSGGPAPLHERYLLLGLTAHVTPQTDVYAFAGGEFLSANASYAQVGAAAFVNGIGSPFFDNTGCGIENPVSPYASAATTPIGFTIATTCSGQTKSVRQITGGFWHTIYSGDFGKLKIGAQYAYTTRDFFPGIGGAPKATDNQFYTSFRYYPF